jgi:2-haloacid dehalogenase
MNRRKLLTLAASGPLLRAIAANARGARTNKAIAFDAFTVFDPRPIAARVEELFPAKGTQFTAIWRTRQFEYTWLRTLTASYTDFWSVTEDALLYAAKILKLELTDQQRQLLMRCFLELRPWPDAPAALNALHDAGIRLVLLSNFTHAMLNTAVSSSGLQMLFEPHLSTDRVRAYKPDLRAYRMAIDELKLRRDEIIFAAFAGWDAAGAKAFGFPTFWVNRMESPLEELGSMPDAIGANLNDLASFVLRGPNYRPLTGINGRYNQQAP